MGEKMNDTKAVVRWVRQHLGLELTKWQRLVLERVMDPTRDNADYISTVKERRLAKLLWEAYCETARIPQEDQRPRGAYWVRDEEDDG